MKRLGMVIAVGRLGHLPGPPRSPLMPPSSRPPSRPRRPPARRPRTPRAASGRERTRRVRLLTGVAVLLLVPARRPRARSSARCAPATCRRRGTEAHRHQVNLLAPRGSLVAADGTDLATDRLAVDVTASPDLVTDDQGVAAQLAPILKRDPNDAGQRARPAGPTTPCSRATCRRGPPTAARAPRHRRASTSPTPTSASSPGGPHGGPGASA